MINIKNIVDKGNYKKHNALISINALIDIDVGLISLIKEQYLDPSVFDIEKLNTYSILDIIRTTYYRLDDNPLYDFSVITDYDTLDNYYLEFNKEEYNAIYDRSTYTDVISMIYMFLESNEIDVSILYYRDYTKDKLLEDIEKGILPENIKLIDGRKIVSEVIDTYDEIFVRSLYELERPPLDKLTKPKTFYISTFGCNFDLDHRLIPNEVLDNLSRSNLNHEVATFEMYTTRNVLPPDNNDAGIMITEKEGDN